jgi:TolB-like protein/Flp pilus assembly protein TadD
MTAFAGMYNVQLTFSGVLMRRDGDSRPNLRPVASASIELPNRLDSWKEIAFYLGRSEKTVRRWEESERLPVRRLHHEKGCSVYAYRSELDAWREERNAAAGPQSVPAAETGPRPMLAVNPSEHTVPERSAHWQVKAAVGLIVSLVLIGSLAGLSYWRKSATRRPDVVRIRSLAVLPFDNLSNDTEQEYLTDGMTEQLITELAKSSSVRVISRTSVMHYKSTRKTLPEITRELNVDAVVKGSLVRSGSRVRLTVQLVTPSPERHLWAEVYEGGTHDLFDLQRDLLRDLGSKLQLPVAALAEGGPSEKNLNANTYEVYLRARHFLAQRTKETMYKAIVYFREVVQRNPGYAPAYSGLAVAYDLLGMYEVLPPQDSFPKVKEFANRALQLDDKLAEAYTARAIAASYFELNWSVADDDFQRAISLQPGLSLTHHWYGEHWINQGRTERAVVEMERAQQLDPLSLPIASTLGRAYRDAHRFERAIEQCRKAMDLDPHYAMAHWCLAQNDIGERRYAAAIEELERAHALGTTPLILRDLGYAYAQVGNASKAKEILKMLQSKAESAYVSPYSIAVIHAALGNKREALGWLEKAYNDRDCSISYIVVDPEVDSLRSDSRFVTLLRRLHIPP